MFNPAVAQKIQLFVVCVAALLIAIFLGTRIGGEHYSELVLGAVIVLLSSVIQTVQVSIMLCTKLRKLILAVTTFDLIIGIITTVFPGSIYKIYPFYSAVSWAGVEELTSGESHTGRIGSFGNFGVILILI